MGFPRAQVKPLFFVACVPRCGSQWLSRLLDTVPEVKIYHNLMHDHNLRYGEIRLMLDTWSGSDRRPYLRKSRERMARIARREAPEARGWGEVNEFIRYYIPEVREVFGVPIAGLIRNGQLTIPSLVRHWFCSPGGTGWTSAIDPAGRPTDVIADLTALLEWPDMDQFTRCCWMWADSYRRLLEQNVPIFTLESLNAGFGNVERLCDTLGISISYEDWQERAGRPVDNYYAGRPRPSLPPGRVEDFQRWAGDVQEHFYG